MTHPRRLDAGYIPSCLPIAEFSEIPVDGDCARIGPVQEMNGLPLLRTEVARIADLMERLIVMYNVFGFKRDAGVWLKIARIPAAIFSI